MVKTIFFGSSLYSNIVLKSLLSIKDIEVVAVVTKPDKPTGRLQAITANPVADFAKNHHLNLLQPVDFDPQFLSIYKNLSPDLVICVAYGPPFFTQEMIDIPTYKIVNIHPSPLPKYRGATPGPWQIINGETNSAVTFFQIDALPDHGPIISQIPFDIKPTWTSHDFYQKAFEIAATHLDETLKSYILNPKSIISQDHSLKSYFPKFTKDTAKIDWSWSVDKIDRFIRAMNPWPIAWTQVKNLNNNQTHSMKIFTAKLNQDKLIPIDVQLESKTKTTWNQISSYYSILKS